MLTTARSTTKSDAASALLEDPRYELMPFDSLGEQLDHLPDGATINITASPTLDLDATIDWAEKAAGRGYEVVPHIAARYVEDEQHLASISERLRDAGITDIFVPGGDLEEPVGKFDSAYQLLQALDGLEYDFQDVGITGYPEGHGFLSDETLAESMAKKAPHATYISTQLCYDPDAIIEWTETIRNRGIELPIEVGIPGVMKYQKLIGISQKVGVGDSVRFLKKTSGILGFIKQFVGSRGKYEPDDLVDGLAPYVNDSEYGFAGFHIYTFNQVPDTESWRQQRLRSV